MIVTSATANLASGDIFKGCQFQQHWYVEVIEADLKPAVIRTYEHQTVPSLVWIGGRVPVADVLKSCGNIHGAGNLELFGVKSADSFPDSCSWCCSV